MKKFLSFIYFTALAFTTIGAAGYLFYHNKSQFAIPVVILGVIHFLGYIGKIEIPKFKYITGE